MSIREEAMELWISEKGTTWIDWDGPPNLTKDFYLAGGKTYHVIEYRAYQELKSKYERILQILDEASKRSSYQWSEGPDYFPSDYANEGRVALALEILAQIRSLR